MKKKFNAEKLQDLRTLAGKTLEQVASEAGFDKSSLSLWENGRRPSPKYLKRISDYYKIPIASFFAMLLLFTATPDAHAVNNYDEVRAIVGEAADQPFVGMIAVGEVIRARGKGINGMVGFHSKHVHTELPQTWAKAWLAWVLSWFTNFTDGATRFENVYHFGFPKQWNRYKWVNTSQYGDHWFFKHVKEFKK